MLFFLCMTGGVLVGSHVYIYRRWIKHTLVSRGQRKIAKYVFIALPIFMVIAIVSARRFNGDFVTPLAYFGFGYMGVLFIAITITVLMHILQQLVERLRVMRQNEQEELAEPERRAALTRGAAVVSAIGTTVLSAESIAQAQQKPKLKRIEVPIKNLPKALEGFRIAQLSDVHIGPTLRRTFLQDVVRRVNDLKPDLIAITGDLVDGKVEQLNQHVQPLQDLRSKHGTFFTTGNHEYYSGADQWIEYLTSIGVRVLRNEHVSLTHDGAPIDVIGVDDWRAKGFGGDHGHDLPKAVRGRDSKRVGILLAHQPKSIFEAAEHDIDLVLSGHTHGGQLWPFRFAVRLVQPYIEGLHLHNDRTRIFVHRGTGYWGIPMRLAVDAEVVELILKRPLQA